MTTIPRATQQAVLADLQERHQLRRYAAQRSRAVVAAEAGVDPTTIYCLLRGRPARFLTEEQVDRVRQTEAERVEALTMLRGPLSIEAIAERHGVSTQTVMRYRERCILERQGLPLCEEEFRRVT